MPDIKELQDFATQVRRDILRQVHKVNSGHPGGSLGCTEFFTALYKVVMDHNTNFTMDGRTKTCSFFPTDISHRFITACLPAPDISR